MVFCDARDGTVHAVITDGTLQRRITKEAAQGEERVSRQT